MPIYEYSCAKCRKKIEVIQKMSDKPLKTHAGCGGKLTKEISASGFQFKGTGWYVTDYARKGQQQDSSESAKPAETSSSEKGDKSDKSDKGGKGDQSEKSDKKETASTTSAPAEKSEKSEKSSKPSTPKKS